MKKFQTFTFTLNPKSTIWLFTLVIDLLGFIPMMIDPFLKRSFWVMLPFIVIIHAWAIILSWRDADAIQKNKKLFGSFCGFVGMLLFLAAAWKQAHYGLHMNGTVLLATAILGYIGFLIAMISYRPKRTGDKAGKIDFFWLFIFVTPVLVYDIYHLSWKHAAYWQHLIVFGLFLLGLLSIYMMITLFRQYLQMKKRI